MPEFIPGIELSRRFYVEAVRPILDEYFPSLAHSAARLQTGSEVLGFAYNLRSAGVQHKPSTAKPRFAWRRSLVKTRSD